MSAVAGASEAEQAVIQEFNQMKQREQQIAQKIGELEGQRQEHTRVLENIEKLPGDRKCFRLIGGVLVERTVADVVPAVKENKENLDKVVVQLKKNHEELVSKIQAFAKKHNIMTKAQAEAQARQQQAEAAN